jgi:hypothetical protein
MATSKFTRDAIMGSSPVGPPSLGRRPKTRTRLGSRNDGLPQSQSANCSPGRIPPTSCGRDVASDRNPRKVAVE